jgi:hypothetical protein
MYGQNVSSPSTSRPMIRTSIEEYEGILSTGIEVYRKNVVDKFGLLEWCNGKNGIVASHGLIPIDAAIKIISNEYIQPISETDINVEFKPKWELLLHAMSTMSKFEQSCKEAIVSITDTLSIMYPSIDKYCTFFLASFTPREQGWFSKMASSCQSILGDFIIIVATQDEMVNATIKKLDNPGKRAPVDTETTPSVPKKKKELDIIPWIQRPKDGVVAETDVAKLNQLGTNEMVLQLLNHWSNNQYPPKHYTLFDAKKMTIEGLDRDPVERIDQVQIVQFHDNNNAKDIYTNGHTIRGVTYPNWFITRKCLVLTGNSIDSQDGIANIFKNVDPKLYEQKWYWIRFGHINGQSGKFSYNAKPTDDSVDNGDYLRPQYFEMTIRQCYGMMIYDKTKQRYCPLTNQVLWDIRDLFDVDSASDKRKKYFDLLALRWQFQASDKHALAHSGITIIVPGSCLESYLMLWKDCFSTLWDQTPKPGISKKKVTKWFIDEADHWQWLVPRKNSRGESLVFGTLEASKQDTVDEIELSDDAMLAEQSTILASDGEGKIVIREGSTVHPQNEIELDQNVPDHQMLDDDGISVNEHTDDDGILIDEYFHDDGVLRRLMDILDGIIPVASDDDDTISIDEATREGGYFPVQSNE